MSYYTSKLKELDRAAGAVDQYATALAAFAAKLKGRDDAPAEHARRALAAECESVAAALKASADARGAVEQAREAAEQAEQEATAARVAVAAAGEVDALVRAKAGAELADRKVKAAHDVFDSACSRARPPSLDSFPLYQGLGQYRAAALRSDLARFADVELPDDGRYGREAASARDWLSGTLRELCDSPHVLPFLASDLDPESEVHMQLYRRLAAKHAAAAA